MASRMRWRAFRGDGERYALELFRAAGHYLGALLQIGAGEDSTAGKRIVKLVFELTLSLAEEWTVTAWPDMDGVPWRQRCALGGE